MSILEVKAFAVGDQYKTDVWATLAYLRTLLKETRWRALEIGRMRKLIQTCARAGFKSSPAVLHEFEGVYAIGQRPGPLTRSAGFYASGTQKETFVVAELYFKHGQKNRDNENDILWSVVPLMGKKLTLVP